MVDWMFGTWRREATQEGTASCPHFLSVFKHTLCCDGALNRVFLGIFAQWHHAPFRFIPITEIPINGT